MGRKDLFNADKEVIHEKRDHKCKGCLCDLFKKLDVGTVVRIAFLEDFFEEDQLYQFVCFNKKSCCVTLIDLSDDNAFIVNCEELVVVEIVNATTVNG
ncbi:hypothetical protein [Alkalihalobacillus sp. AL-G]|uniref:hypothetical protein n=1 Tax=Alkalihalobacillus sp. AL-G TaxID=2926399 RepID=UPI00272D402C|nr:hypothetical protein [Alkalihalobacillus sp. AL-G]WLD94975.1 hypothetical protein MOJ78_08875 [Alkalihalobacillus sp. AL-G]